MDRRLTLILGGARSGKSRQAEALASECGGGVLYVATAEALDGEMFNRIVSHRERRPAPWRTLEAPRRVGRAIVAELGTAEIVLLDCVTLLANNVWGPEAESSLHGEAAAEALLMEEVDELLEVYRASRAWWLVVSNEVGMGLVPPTPLGRAYRDALGRANQRLARAADEVLFMIAGLPMRLKG